MGSGAKSYMKKVFLIYEEMRKYSIIFEEAVSHLCLCTRSLLNFLLYEENFVFFLSVYQPQPPSAQSEEILIRLSFSPIFKFSLATQSL
jgi:hypothetical protein